MVFGLFASVRLVFGEDKHSAPKHPPSSAKSHSKTPETSHAAKGAPGKTRKPKPKEKILPEQTIGKESKLGHKEFDAELLRNPGVDIVILLDSSGSMRRTDPKRIRDQAAKLLIRFLTEDDRVAVFQFDREAKIVSPFVKLSPDNIPVIDSAIEKVPTEGGFTDLEAAIQGSYQLLTTEGRQDASRCVLLLSDGQMDPHPSRGTAETLTSQVISVDLPLYREKKIKLYTVAMSEEADRELLAKLASATDGLHWFAPDVDTIHLKFSSLMLALKAPQVVSLDKGGFEIDGSVSEATFYITRQEKTQNVILLDPTRKEITNTHLPPDVKWFKGELFDVITVRRPFPGNWAVGGVEPKEGFASLLTDLKLQVKLPKTNFNIGDNVLVVARLIDKDQVLNEPALREIVYFTYKIINSENGQIFSNGSLLDTGQNGDEIAGDSLYSTMLKLNQEGDFKALIGVTSPTFTRQQLIPFSVSSGMIHLKLIAVDTFATEPEGFEVSLGKETRDLQNLKVQLVAKKGKDGQPFLLKITPAVDEKGKYRALTSQLRGGTFQVYATMKGSDAEGKHLQGTSETLDYEAAAGEPELQESLNEEDTLKQSPQTKRDLLVGLLCIVLAFGWGGALGYIVYRRFNIGETTATVQPEYVVPGQMEVQLAAIRQKTAQTTRRAPNAEDLVIFQLVKETYDGLPREQQSAFDSPSTGNGNLLGSSLHTQDENIEQQRQEEFREKEPQEEDVSSA